MGFLSKLLSMFTKTSEAKVSVTKQGSTNAPSSDLPPYQGDYAKTIFLWAHNKPSPIKSNDNYARYFLYECGISNPSEFHLNLINDGYFKKAPIDTVLNSLKVAELKEILSSLAQPVTGKKDALIERILSIADEDAINSFCKEDLFVLSENGELFLSQHSDYVQLHTHKNWGITWQEYDTNHRSGISFYDTVWGILNKRILQDQQNFGRGEYFHMYQLLVEEGKRERAIEMLLRVLYIDLSGVYGMNSYKMYKSGFYNKIDLFEHFDVAIMLAPGIVNPIAEFKDVYSDEIANRLYEQKLPVQICDKKLFLTLVHSILDGTYDESEFEKKLQSAYNKFIKSL